MNLEALRDSSGGVSVNGAPGVYVGIFVVDKRMQAGKESKQSHLCSIHQGRDAE
jgi:hypothetical protein